MIISTNQRCHDYLEQNEENLGSANFKKIYIYNVKLSVPLNSLQGLESLGGLDDNTEWIIVELICTDGHRGTAWYSVPAPVT